MLVSDLSIPSYLSLQLKIEGISGKSYTGDIALDDLSVADGSCAVVIPTTVPTALPPTGSKTLSSVGFIWRDKSLNFGRRIKRFG